MDGRAIHGRRVYIGVLSWPILSSVIGSMHVLFGLTAILIVAHMRTTRTLRVPVDPEGPFRLPLWNQSPETMMYLYLYIYIYYIHGSGALMPYWQSKWAVWLRNCGINADRHQEWTREADRLEKRQADLATIFI